MSAAPAGRSPFWRFSVGLYGVAGVPDACIALQDQAAVDVNLLFFLLWTASQGRALDQAEVADLDRQVGAWRDLAVIPLRTLRRALKAPPAVIGADAAEEFRTRIKGIELEAERLQQEAMFRLADAGRPAASSESAARASIAAYQAVLGPFPAGAVDVVLAAFANFKMPATDKA
jgi:uncharacterized protein (TIGR02444 family)